MNGMPMETVKTNEMKLDIWEKLYNQADAEVVGISEHKLNIPLLSRQDKPSNTMKNWKENLVSRFSWLQSRDKGKYELGGTGIITSARGTTHTIREGRDDKHLGRWNWITLQGKRDIKTTVISIYRPIQGQQTLQRQYARLCEKQNIKEGDTTLSIWESDLSDLITSFQAKGHEVVVGGDWNDDLNKNKGRITTLMRNTGMTELLIERYGKGPNTHQRGKDTIDGVFGTSGIKMLRGGYTTFDCSPSDHRWVWIDIAESDIVGTNRDDRPPPIERRTTSKIPSVKTSFSELLEQQVIKHQLQEKMEKLFKASNQTKHLTTEQKEDYEAIDERIRRAVKYADKRCRKLRRGKLPFSPTVTKIIGAIRVLKVILIRHVTKGQPSRPHMSNVRRIAQKYKYKGPLTFESKEAILAQLSAAKTAYHNLVPKAYEARYRYLEDIASEYADRDDKGAAWHFRRLLQQAKSKEHFKHLRRVEGKGFRRGVDRVDIQGPDGKETILDRTRINTVIRDANIARRLQSKHTPLRTEPLRTLIGERMNFERWESILRKEVLLPTQDLEEGTRLWFEYMQQYEDKPMDIQWTPEEYCESWSKMPEDKSCLPGIHTAHIKCIDFESKAAEVMSRLALIPLITGYAPQYWKQGIDSMIPKKVSGELRPEKLRLILLMDSRFNHNNKLIGKKIMEFGEKNLLFAQEQFGSRKAKSAIEHAVNKRLTLDISRQTKTKCIYIANDAKSCYDRILMMVTYLTMRNFGIPKAAAWSSIETLTSMTIRIKTVYGISELEYGGDEWEDTPHGCGQGNGYGPAIWAAISSPLLEIMKAKGYGTHISAPITKEQLHMAAFSFVDDTDQIEINNSVHHPWNHLVHRTQSSLSLWESLLRTTGGAIEPSKSDWTRLEYLWKQGKATLKSTLSTDILTMRDTNGNIQELQQQTPQTSRETLGVWQAPDGNDKVQVEKLITKIKDWGTTIAKSDMKRSEARSAVHVTIGKSIRYPLAATAISSKQAQTIDSAFRHAALGKMGIVRTAPSLPAGAPLELGGFGMAHNIEINQMIDHLDICTKHGHTSSATGHLLRASFESLAMEAGVAGDPTQMQIQDIPWVTANTWVGNTIQSLAKYSLELHSGLRGLKLWTNIDEITLMEMAAPLLTSSNGYMFNKVRQHLKIVTISDILTADGRTVDTNIYNAKRSQSPSPSIFSYQWPTIPPPTKKEIKCWQDHLNTLFQISSSNLRFPSEAIMKWDVKTRNSTQWNIEPTSGLVYERTKTSWKQWKLSPSTSRRSGRTYTPHSTVTSIPSTVVPISITQHTPCRLGVIARGEYTSYEENQRAITNWVMRNVQSSINDETNYANGIVEGTAEIVSDGSYKNGRSSSACRVINTNISVSNTVPGPKEDQSSYRAELGGILTGLTYTNNVCKQKGITSGHCTFYCDNKGALQAAFGWKTPNSRWTCYDLVCLIRYQVANSPLKWKWKHIYGHQDNSTSYEHLSPQAQANVDADKAAAAELSLGLEPTSDPLPGQPWQLFDPTSNEYITGQFERLIRIRVFDQPMKAYWTRKFDLGEDSITPTRWATFKRHNKRLPKHVAIWQSKFNQRLLGVKTNLYRRGHSGDSTCPLCSLSEDTDHIFQCPSPEASEAYQEGIDDVATFLTSTTSADLRDALLEVCRCFRLQCRPHISNTWDTPLIHAVQQQLQLGPRAFIGGIWVDEWITVQSELYLRTKRQSDPQLWVSKAIASIQQLLKHMWTRRCKHMHQTESSQEKMRLNAQVNIKIDEIFHRQRSLNSRILSHEAVSFFQLTKQHIKTRTLRRKQRWIQDAEDILHFMTTLTAQQQQFLAYFKFRDSG